MALASVLAGGDARAGVKLRRALLRPARVVTIALGWPSSAHLGGDAAAHSIVLKALESWIDLSTVYSGTVSCGEVVPARLRGMCAFDAVRNHWLGFFDSEPRGAPPVWVKADDERVALSPNPVSVIMAAGLAPTLLFFEAEEVGDTLPSDRGRSSLVVTLQVPPSQRAFPALTLQPLSSFSTSEASWADLVDADEAGSLSLPLSAFGTPIAMASGMSSPNAAALTASPTVEGGGGGGVE